MKKLRLIIVIALILSACNTTNTSIPIRHVNFTVAINSTNLIHVGGHEYFTGGISGIVVYRFDMTTFYAYDRACPYDWEDGGRVSVVGATLYDSLCGSSFNILNGYPYSNSKAALPLRQYQTTLINDFTLQIYN